MKPIKKIISEGIVSPMQKYHQYQTVPAMVVKTYDDNTCLIDYSDQFGYQRRMRVSVLMADPSGWFPEKNEVVVAEEKSGVMFVVAPHTEQYVSAHHYKHNLRNDMLDDGCVDTMPGYMY